MCVVWQLLFWRALLAELFLLQLLVVENQLKRITPRSISYDYFVGEFDIKSLTPAKKYSRLSVLIRLGCNCGKKEFRVEFAVITISKVIFFIFLVDPEYVCLAGWLYVYVYEGVAEGNTKRAACSASAASYASIELIHLLLAGTVFDREVFFHPQSQTNKAVPISISSNFFVLYFQVWTWFFPPRLVP